MKSLKLFTLLTHLVLIPSIALSQKRSCEKQYWTIPNSETATITFDSELLSGHFVLYDNLHGSGTQIKGLLNRGLTKRRGLPPNYNYKFVAFMESSCEKLTNNVYFQIDVTDSFIPKEKGLTNKQGGMKKMIKTTTFSWYWGPDVKIVVVAYENQASIRREDWKQISCAEVVEVVSSKDTLSNIQIDDAID